MAVGTLDQHQDNEGQNFGFGIFATPNVRYRGQCFTPALVGSLATIGFSRVKSSQGIKVYIDATSANQPAHGIGSALYTFEIAFASLVDGYGTYDLPTPFPLTVGVQYCFYLAPWSVGSTEVYTDDYADLHGTNVGTVEITNTNGIWSNENLTLHYATYMLPMAQAAIHGLSAIDTSIQIQNTMEGY